MSVATHDTNHAAEMAANLLSFLKGKPNLAALLACFAAEVQAAEDALWQLLTQRYALSGPPAGQSLAAGAQLDGIGDIVVQPRNGFIDPDYTAQLLAKIVLNTGSGRINDVLGLAVLMNPGASVVLQQAYPATFAVFTSSPITNGATQASAIRSATAAGVSSQLIAPTAPLSNTFTLADSRAIVGNPALQGWGDSTNAAIGGFFASSY